MSDLRRDQRAAACRRRRSTSRSRATRPARPSGPSSRRGWRRWPRRASRSRSSSAGRRFGPARPQSVGDAVQASPRAGATGTWPSRGTCSRPSRRRSKRAAGLVGLALGGSRGGVPQGGRLLAADLAARRVNAATMLGQAKTVVPVRDRRRLRAASTSGASTSRTPPSSMPSSRSTARASGISSDYRAARRLRLRGVAVQLHGDRRQPARRRPCSWAASRSGSRPRARC